MINVEQLLNLSVRLAAPVILICLGGLFSIKVDIFNLALEGFTLFGCRHLHDAERGRRHRLCRAGDAADRVDLRVVCL